MSADVAIPGNQIDLPDNRHVWVGEYEDVILIQFCATDGRITRLRLSKEAAAALKYLLGGHVQHTDAIKSFLAHMIMTTEEEHPQFEWREVKPDTAAPLTSGE